MIDPGKNFAKVTVSTGYDASATSVALTSGHGAKLPQPSTDGAFNLVWWDSTNYPDPADDPKVEIVRCTARSTDTLTVTRNQESSGASTKNTGGATYKMILAVTKKTKDDIIALTEIPMTTGETINASSTPQAVYVKNSDGKIYKTDSDADESAFKYIGFVGGSQNTSTNSTAIVTVGGVLDGFSSLTINKFYYLGATAGAITDTPPGARSLEVALPVSATKILILQSNRKFAATSSSLSDGTGNGANTITIGFRPRVIHMTISTSCQSCGSSWAKYAYWIWADGSNSENMRFGSGGAANAINSFGDFMGGDSNLSLSIASVTDTSFDISYTRDSTWSSGYSMNITVWG